MNSAYIWAWGVEINFLSILGQKLVLLKWFICHNCLPIEIWAHKEIILNYWKLVKIKDIHYSCTTSIHIPRKVSVKRGQQLFVVDSGFNPKKFFCCWNAPLMRLRYSWMKILVKPAQTVRGCLLITYWPSQTPLINQCY